MLKTVLMEKSETDWGICHDTNVLLNDVLNDLSIKLYNATCKDVQCVIGKNENVGSKPYPS